MTRLAELDPHANATDRRAAPSGPRPSEGVPRTAATLAFGHDLRPLVGPDGGFSEPEDDPAPNPNLPPQPENHDP